LTRRSRASVPAPTRRLFPSVDHLDARTLLSTTGVIARPMFEVRPYTGGSPPAGALTPAQIRTAYGFNNIVFGSTSGDGTGQTIAIVDAYDDPNIQADLNTFDTQFGLPATTVSRVNQTGGTAYPTTDPSGGWELEESLDVEWAHAIAPGASILLVEANSPNDSDLLAAVDYAAAHAGVVSMSWGAGEFSGESADDVHFSHAGVSFVAASGDNGAPISWPAASPDVLAVGGTNLALGTGGAWVGEGGWTGSGGGPSAYYNRPSYQGGVVTQTTMRANPDVAYDADPSSGFAVYDSFTGVGGWALVGGTSAGSPQWAALLAIANQGRALNGAAALNATNPQAVLAALYQGAGTAEFHDVTSGTSTGTPNYSAGPGYDYVTGIGTPVANQVVSALVGTPVANDTLLIAAPSSATAGTSFGVTVTAHNASGSTDPNYRGTVHLTSSDGQALLPANYTFTAGDAGSHTFTVTLQTPGTQTVTATDTATGASVTSPGISVTAASPAPSYSLFGPNAAPAVASNAWATTYELGVKFFADGPGQVTALRFYEGPGGSGTTNVGHLWDAAGHLLATAAFSVSGTGWQQVTLSQPVSIAAGQTYVASYYTDAGHFAYSGGYFAAGVDSGPLHAPAASAVGGLNGVYHAGGSAFPDQAYNASNYWVDLVYSPTTTGAAHPAAPAPTGGPASTTGAAAPTGGNGGTARLLVIAPGGVAPPTSPSADGGKAGSPRPATVITASWPTRRVPQAFARGVRPLAFEART
jgi:hypothetical protein